MKKVAALCLSAVLFLPMTGCDTSEKTNTSSDAPAKTADTTVSTVFTQDDLQMTTSTSAEATTTTATTAPAPEQPEDDVVPGSTPLFYKAIDSDGDCVWLMGSIHVAEESMYPLPTAITQAYEQADALAVECDVVAVQNDYAAMVSMVQTWMYEAGDSIDQHISAELYEDAVAILKENNSYLPLYDRYIPSVWSSLIDSMLMEKLGYRSENGIDMYFLNRAYEEEKPILEIESFEFQNDMLVGFSPALQEMLLEGSVASYYEGDSMRELVDMWCSGDEEAFAAYLLTEDDDLETEEEKALYEEYYTAMSVDRNINMADYAEDCLMRGEEVFICVGAAHIVGEGAMVDLLRERGYTVELVK